MIHELSDRYHHMISRYQEYQKQYHHKMKWFKIRIFLLITLPIFIVTLLREVVRSYTRLKLKKISAEAAAKKAAAKAPQQKNTEETPGSTK